MLEEWSMLCRKTCRVGEAEVRGSFSVGKAFAGGRLKLLPLKTVMF